MKKKNYRKSQYRKSGSYWSRSWTLGNIIYFFISIFLMILMILLTGFLKKQSSVKITWSNAISVGCVTVMGIGLLVLISRSGFGKGLASPILSFYHNYRINMRAKAKYYSGMNQFEKDKILNSERNAYNIEQTKKSKNKNILGSTNLASYLIIGISSLTLVIGMLAIHL
ncbi:hypothetical protein [Mycoplasma sp. 3398]